MYAIEHFLHSTLHFQITLIAFLMAFIAYTVAYIYFVKQRSGKSPHLSENLKQTLIKVADAIFAVAFILAIALFVMSWIEAGRPPFRTLYETLIYIIVCFSTISFVAQMVFKVRIFGLLNSLIVLGVFIYALQQRDVERATLMPALQTWVMIPHVTAYIIGYSGLAVAGVSSMLYLISPSNLKGYWAFSDEETIDYSKYTYPIVKFGFLFLTIGLLLGSWWGQEAWSNYWGWDPKENWALISWFAFASYFHLKHIKAWGERKLAWVVLIGVAAVLFTYLGMKFLPKDVQDASLHIYIEE